MVFFVAQIFNFDEVQFIFFFACIFMYFKSIAKYLIMKEVPVCFLKEFLVLAVIFSFIVLAVIFKSEFHFELSF